MREAERCATTSAPATSRGPLVGRSGQRIALAILIILFALKLVLSTGKTIAAIAHSEFDDLLFSRLAEEIVRTGWLGPYDELTLAKGPVYPLFLAANYIAGTPLLLAQQALYVVAGLVFLRALRPLLPNRWLRLGVFALYLFNPAATSGASDHIIRELIYASLAVIVVGCGVGVLANAVERRGALAWSVGLGVAGALFWMTREEGVWLVPAVVLLLASSAWLIWTRIRSPTLRWRRLASILLPVLAFALVDGACAAVNYQRYGVFTTEEFRYGPFRDAYGALLRVRHPVDDPLIPVPRIVRQAIYRESPSFKLLEPSLERDWIGESCHQYPNLRACDDLPGFAFVWALRTAAAKAGYYRSGTAMRDYFATLAQEVNDACAAARLTCGPPRSTLMPPMPWTQMAQALPPAFYRAARLVITFTDTGPTQVPSRPDEALRAKIARFAHNEVAPSAETPSPRAGDVAGVAGWVYLPDHRPFSVQLYAGGDPLPIPQHRAEGADVANHFHDPGAHGLRFDLAGICPLPCSLLVVAGDRATFVPLSAVVTGTHPLAASDGTLYLDRVTIFGATEPLESPPAWPRLLKLRLLHDIFAAYQAAAPVLILAGLAAYLAMAAAMLMGARSRLFVVETALLGGAATLAALVSLIEVTAYPLTNAHYLAPCFPFILLFAALAVIDLARALTARAIRRHPARSARS